MGLVIVIVALCCEPQNLIAFSSGHQDQKAKISVPFDFENVVISHLSPQVEPLGSLRQFSQFMPVENPGKNGAVEFIFTGPNSGDAKWNQTARHKAIIEIVGYNRNNKINFRQNSNVTGGSLAVVDDVGPKFKRSAAFPALSVTNSRFYGNVGPQLPYTEISSFPNLGKDRNYQQKIGYKDSTSQSDNGVVKELVNEPRKRIIVSYLIGAFSGTIGIALYLNGWGKVGIGLIGLGLLTPIIPWWLIWFAP